MKFLKTIALGAIALASSAALADAPAASFQGQGGLSYIRVGSNFGLCGGITITPILDNYPQDGTLFLVAKRFDSSGRDMGELGREDLPAEGVRREYSWEGLGDAHARIYLYKKKYSEYTGKEYLSTPLDPEKYVTIQDKHNVACVIGPAGSEADIGPLNLRQK